MSEHELWNELGNLYFLSGSYDHAIRAYNRAIELSPETGEPYSNLALTYAQMGKYPEASDFYQQSIHRLKDEMDKAVSLYKLGDVLLRLKKFSQAAETYQQTEEIIPDLGQIVEASKPSDLLLHSPVTTILSQQVVAGDGSASVDEETSPYVEELTPWWFDDQPEPEDSPETDYDFWYLDESGVHISGENVFSTEPLNWEADQSFESQSTEEEQQVKDVVEEEVADDLEDQDLETVEQFDAEETDNDPSIAAKPVDEVIDEDASVTDIESVPVLVVTDKPEILTESPEFSVEDITNPEAVRYDTSAEWPVVDLSEADRQEISAEINRYKRVLEINPRNAIAWDMLGGNFKLLGQYDEAIEAFGKAVSLDGTKASYFHHLGLVYAAVGRNEEAINAFERVIEVDPNHPLAHATLGGYYRKNGNEELAKEHIEKARDLISNDENEYNRACMEAICGNTDHSLELLELALKNKQTYVNWACKDPDLDFIRSDPRFHTLLAEYAMK